MPLIEVKDLSFFYDQALEKVIKRLSLQIGAGEFVSIQGPSGSGKSTLLYLLAGFLRPTSGHIFFAGQDLTSLDESETAIFRNRRMGFIFQQFHLVSRKTVLENVLMPELYPVEVESKNDDAEPRAIQILAKLGLGDKLH